MLYEVITEARYVQYKGVHGDELNEIMSNVLIQELKTQQATLQSEYENLAVTFKPDYPQMRQLKARLDDIAIFGVSVVAILGLALSYNFV